MIKRPRPGSVVILAPPGTPISVSGTEEYEKVVLLEVPGVLAQRETDRWVG
jgi:hypothetical protein